MTSKLILYLPSKAKLNILSFYYILRNPEVHKVIFCSSWRHCNHSLRVECRHRKENHWCRMYMSTFYTGDFSSYVYILHRWLFLRPLHSSLVTSSDVYILHRWLFLLCLHSTSVTFPPMSTFYISDFTSAVYILHRWLSLRCRM